VNVDVASTVAQLVARPNETLSVELKGWIDPSTPHGIAKIARAALAMRNYGGGFVLIGFNDETHRPDLENVPQDIRGTFHPDKIQAIVSRFASDPFEVTVDFSEHERQVHPVLIIPPGVKTPVAAKSDLSDNGIKLISAGDVYVRSLRANNTASTTKAGWQDWAKLVETCFDNREADIGRFLRRHLSHLTSDVLKDFGSALSDEAQSAATLETQLRGLLLEGEARFNAVLMERSLTLPRHGSLEAALIIEGSAPPHFANSHFLNLLESSNPNYTGWPIWLDSRSFTDTTARPYVNEGAWEALILVLNSEWGANKIDFLRLGPSGRFYLRRGLEDDLSKSPNAPAPGEKLDFGIATLRVAETIAVGLAYAHAMGYKSEATRLGFAFRWKGLKDRTLSSWANPARYLSVDRSAYQDEVEAFVQVGLDTPLSALGEHVGLVTARLFEVFDGFSLSGDVTESLVRQLVERKL
jgi:hypothetical protein